MESKNTILKNYINIDNRFLISKYLVIQEEYEEVMGVNPSYFRGEKNLPVESVSWYDAIEFCNKKSLKYNLEPVYIINKIKNPTSNSLNWIVEIDNTKNGFRLPTEEEWEYAAKGGSKSKGFKYSGSNNADEVGWYKKNSGRKTHPIGLKKANEFGLYDMSGNLCEWCWSNWNDDKFLYGGAWCFNSNNLRLSLSHYSNPFSIFYGYGFRCVQSL